MTCLRLLTSMVFSLGNSSTNCSRRGDGTKFWQTEESLTSTAAAAACVVSPRAIIDGADNNNALQKIQPTTHILRTRIGERLRQLEDAGLITWSILMWRLPVIILIEARGWLWLHLDEYSCTCAYKESDFINF